MKLGVGLIAGLVLSGSAHADGLTLKLEGGASIVSFTDTGIFQLERDAPPPAVFFSDLEDGMHRGPISDFYRGEANLDLALSSDRTLRLGLVRSGLNGSLSQVTPVYFWTSSAVKYSPDGQIMVVHGQLGVCPLVNGQPEPCATFHGGIDRTYAEIMPQILLGRSSGDQRTWIGLQGFSGRLDETTSGWVDATPYDSEHMMTEVTGDADGLMLAIHRERPLASGARLTLGLGLGAYRMTATGLSYIEGERNPNAMREDDFHGVRAQLSAGIEYPLSDRLSLGGTIRADLWSAQPLIDMDLPDAQCIERLVCHMDVPANPFGLTTDPFATISVGLSLTLRL